MARILVADSLSERRNIICVFLRGDDHVLIPASRQEEAIELARELHPDLVIVEGNMSGMKLFAEARELDPRIGVILILASPPPVERVVELMKQGVSDFLVSPLNIDDVRDKVERALDNRQQPEAVQIRFHNLVGSSRKMQQVFQRAIKMALSDTPMLLLGPRGTGKHSLAREIHSLSTRKEAPFKVIRCAGASPTALESELFGHEAGAFSWAVERRRGEFELGEGGSAYVDEIGQIDIELQAKLLRFVETGTFQRLGGDRILTGDTRILAGTCEPLNQRVQGGGFREDLFFCLSANCIELPPLRSRVSDIPELIGHFLSRYEVQIAREAVEVLMNYSWPGNVDELKAAIEQAVTLCDDNRIELKDLPPLILRTVAMSDRKHKYMPRSKEKG